MGVNRYRAAILYVIFDRHVSVGRLFYLNINYLVKLNFFSWRILVILGFLGPNFYTLFSHMFNSAILYFFRRWMR